MSLGIDPLVSNLLYSLTLLPLLPSRRVPLNHTKSAPPAEMPSVSVIVALYDEPFEDIAMTVSSLSDQTYPSDRYEVLFAVEPDDARVEQALLRLVPWLRERGIATSQIVSDGGRHLKARALNTASSAARGDYLAFYDAGDTIEPDQIEKAVGAMMRERCDVGQARVLRSGPSAWARLLQVDCAAWFVLYLPFVLGLAGGFPLSGEGLFVRRDVLMEAGGFPEVLTEDAMLGMYLAERDKRFGLIDSNVIEKAPRSLAAHFVQRLRWSRGYLTCLARLLRGQMTWPRKLGFALLFAAPVMSALGCVGWWLLALEAVRAVGNATPFMLSASKSVGPTLLWSLTLLGLGIPFAVVSAGLAAEAVTRRPPRWELVLLPAYWMFVGFTSLCAFFRGTRRWGRTRR